MKVFLSHSSRDKWAARRIAEEIERLGVDTFLDEKDIETGMSIDTAIHASLRECEDVLVLLSPVSIKSSGVAVDFRRVIKPVKDQLEQGMRSGRTKSTSSSQVDSEKQQEVSLPKTTAIGAVVADRRGATYFASLTLLLTLALYLGVTRLSGNVVDLAIVVIIAVAILAINVGAMAFAYRVSHGLYGTTEYEAREIIHFVLARTDNVDFSSGLGARNIDISEEQLLVLTETWTGATA
jgi:hypothetical protein